jgi:hypothetical protein
MCLNVNLIQCFLAFVPRELFKCATKLLRILQFSGVFEKLGENFPKLPWCEKVSGALVCRKLEKVENHWFSNQFYDYFNE